MDEKTITLSSGSTLKMLLLDFNSAEQLRVALLKACSGQSFGLASLDVNDLSVTTIINLLISIDTSQEVRDCIRKSAGRCFYNGIHLLLPMEYENACREDYYEIAGNIIYYNLFERGPFKHLLTKFKDVVRSKKQPENQES